MSTPDVPRDRSSPVKSLKTEQDAHTNSSSVCEGGRVGVPTVADEPG